MGYTLNKGWKKTYTFADKRMTLTVLYPAEIFALIYVTCLT